VHVVATAGHVDHGKSTLVRALTGQDPDRLSEEHRRGLSIELGYCWTTMDPVGEVAFVDVPGHERFLTTTLSGLGPVPVVMFVVAADDPWMPQSAEHLTALDALGVSQGVLVVTRADLQDPATALARARERVDSTSLAGCPSVVVSGRTGSGMADLRRALTEVLTGMPEPDDHADVRIWIDRAFHVRGSGTVVTGTLPAGTVRVGDQLSLDGEQVRVRGLESLGTSRSVVTGVARVALQLGGHAGERPSRGAALVTPEAFEDVTTFDVVLHGQGVPPEAPMLHIGATRLAVRVRPLGGAFVRLRLESPLPLRHGDRAILRDPGSRAMWGVEVLDGAPPPLVRRGAARARSAHLAHRGHGLAAEVVARRQVRRSLLTRLGVRNETLPEGTVTAGDWLVSAQRAEEWRRQLRSLIAETPDGLTDAAATHALGVPDLGLLPDLVVAPLVQRHGRILDPDTDLPAELRRALEELRDHLSHSPFASPEAGRLRDLGLDRAAQARLARHDLLLVLADGIVLLPGADEQALVELSGLPQPFTTAEARERLGTSRRVVLPLLAHLDRTGRTVRLPDDRRTVR
jgi:selenocysteine-specific elongation factor